MQARKRVSDLSAKVDALAREIAKLQAPRVRIELVRERVEYGFDRREGDRIRKVFEKYSTFVYRRDSCPLKGEGRLLPLRPYHYEKLIINPETLRQALEDLDVRIHEGEVNERFLSTDIDDNGGLDFEEFQTAVHLPTQVTGWADSLPLAALLADALPTEFNDKNPLKLLSTMDAKDIDVVVQGFSEGLRKMLVSKVRELQDAFENMRLKIEKKQKEAKEKPTANKFENVDVRQMKCGTLADYHQGIENRIGSPHLDFLPAMEKEHCVRAGHDFVFEADNYRIKTKPVDEWGYIVKQIPVPPELMQNKRTIPKIEDLMKLDVAVKSKLQRPEVISLVLYTGPMFHIYNSILRQYPLDVFKKFKDGENLYSTTIFVLASAVQKIARVMKLPKGLCLYRGLGGVVDFPESFFKNDENGCTGFAEWGFMSTTAQKHIAINYSGVKLDKPLPIVLVITVGAADRGACIKEFSQYPYEVEYLWVPASFLEQGSPRFMEVTPDGIVQMVPVKVNANLKTYTIEELMNRKKNMHVYAFKYQITEIVLEMQKAVSDVRVAERLERDSTRKYDAKFTVQNFVTKIVDQCKDVLKRHEGIDSKMYAKDEMFRSLVLEMVDVKTMALSKLKEWIENEASSFIAFRFNAELRTAHRRRITFLHRTLEAGLRDPAATALTWCKIKGLVREHVEERNEQSETNLMVAAAEGRSATEIRILTLAGASVDAVRPDGVSAIWLAAQFGHTQCIEELILKKANPNAAATNQATAVYTAAQSGYDDCIKLLADLGANVKTPDKDGKTPMHQAAMNGNIKCIEVLHKFNADIAPKDTSGKSPLDLTRDDECKKLLARLAGTTASVKSTGKKKLIISSGDISDVDGFLALAQYAKTGADVLFMMNYPAYVGVKDGEEDPQFEDENPGLGFKYSATQVFNSCKVDPKNKVMYEQFLDRYKEVKEDGLRMKAAMTDLAFFMATNVWNEAKVESTAKGELLFCIGGINAVNPFSKTAIKNEVYVYSSVLTEQERSGIPRLSTDEGTIYTCRGSGITVSKLAYNEYSHVYMDFNGSMAFLDDNWIKELNGLVPVIKGVFIMGGVYSDAKPLTMPAIPGVLNRFSSATMNQLYHPKRSCDLFSFLAQHKAIPVFTITNNVVADLATFDDPETKKVKNMTGVDKFLKENGIHAPFIAKFTKAHYESQYNPPRKAFDYYTALAVHTLIREEGGGQKPTPTPSSSATATSTALRSSPRRLFYCDDYGLTIVGNEAEGWQQALEDYFSRIDREPSAADDAFNRTRKANFTREHDTLQNVESPVTLAVYDVNFTLHKDTHALTIIRVAAKPPTSPAAKAPP